MEPITEEEKSDFRRLLAQFYGDQATNWHVTRRSYELFGELISRTKQCDAAMNWVPRPFYAGNALNWAKKQVRKTVVRHFLKDENKHYITCMKTVALKMKTQFYMAQYE